MPSGICIEIAQCNLNEAYGKSVTLFSQRNLTLYMQRFYLAIKGESEYTNVTFDPYKYPYLITDHSV